MTVLFWHIRRCVRLSESATLPPNGAVRGLKKGWGGGMSSSSSSALSRLPARRITAAPFPKHALILQQVAQLLAYDDKETLETISEAMAFRLELLAARDAIH
jgi:hypothetical protein